MNLYNLEWKREITHLFLCLAGKKETNVDFAKFRRNKQRIFLFCNFVCYLLFIGTFRWWEGERGVGVKKEERGFFNSFGFCKLHQSANFLATHIIKRTVCLYIDVLYSYLLLLTSQLVRLKENQYFTYVHN